MREEPKRPELSKINDFVWEIGKGYKPGMRVPARIVASQKLVNEMDAHVFGQLTNVATLPGIQDYAYCMSDGHSGYGFPIGGVAAFDLEEGIISPGGVGFDINCGVRLIRTNLTFNDVKPKIKEIIDRLYGSARPGVGAKGASRLSKNDLNNLLNEGAKWVIQQGQGWEKDLEMMEDRGCIESADDSKVSEKAKSRGIDQVGTLGSGNHYLEIQHVPKGAIFEDKIAKKFGIFEDQIVIMVHCGSRGLGHQVGTDYLRKCLDIMPKYGIKVIDKELASAPFNSKEGQDYFKAMCASANMAFANRQVLMHGIREGFSKIFGSSAEELGMELVYDVAHNIAKVEEHSGKKLLVHRKGATRSFGPGRKELSPLHQETGQPVIIGGSMETMSYLLVGTDESEMTFGSTCHGSGRVMSRAEAKSKVRGDELKRDMEAHGIYVKAVSLPGLAEEAGLAYKDVSEVINSVHNAGISKKIASFKPLGNIKG
ncbi:RtcB family protein [Candidatus Woesearchaeota archaeon]|nr:RtcB family protein [Candidatus Woesearchaeota archaeon]